MSRTLRGFVLLAVVGAGLAACQSVPQNPRFVVFFTDFSGQLDNDAKGVIQAAAVKAKAEPASPVTVLGFADPSGSPQANLDLSLLRAQVVSDGLVAAGVPPARITRKAVGATSYELTPLESRRVSIVVGNP